MLWEGDEDDEANCANDEGNDDEGFALFMAIGEDRGDDDGEKDADADWDCEELLKYIVRYFVWMDMGRRILSPVHCCNRDLE
jgi:hypothetical protein